VEEVEEMKYNPSTHHRHSIRLKGYDYSQPGAYFVTLCTWQRECLFGEIHADEMQLSAAGKVAAYYWKRIPVHFPTTSLDEWIIMPNHLHGIIILGTGDASAGQDIRQGIRFSADASPLQPQRPIGTASGSLGAILQNYKSITSRKINPLEGSQSSTVWQRNYYDHIIRDEQEWERISAYIRTNPTHWKDDQEYLSTQRL
jgi:REP element-mobilizing transposase RayT